MAEKLSTDPYKGVRDFYPEDMFIEKWIFDVMRRTVEQFGYSEYNASPLEPSELYRGKTSEEIVNEQTYSFKDRGDRDVTLRPEMTPTVARMVAARKRELQFPLRWYSIPNVFRYEKPQRGRLREHYQLNVDLFGVSGIEAEIENISIAYSLMRNLGAKDSDFEIRVNSRKLLQAEVGKMLKNKDSLAAALRLIDKRDKLSPEDFASEWKKISDQTFSLEIVPSDEIKAILASLNKSGVANAVFWPTLVRGFDYYTDVVFEIFDKNPENRRALFGGGRYDNLLSLFGAESLPAVGFGAGDVTIRDFLEVRGLLPAYKPSAQIAICTFGADEPENVKNGIQEFSNLLREAGLNVYVNFSSKNIKDQIKLVDKQKIPYIVCIGADEIASKSVTIKQLDNQQETEFSDAFTKATAQKIASYIKKVTEEALTLHK